MTDALFKFRSIRSAVPDAAIACLLYAATAGFAVAHSTSNDDERQQQIDRARDMINDAIAARDKLIGTADQFFCPALTAAIESAEIEIAWAQNAPGRQRNYDAIPHVLAALYPAPARPAAEEEKLYDTIDNELADAEIITADPHAVGM